MRMRVRETYATISLSLVIFLSQVAPLYGQASRQPAQKAEEEVHVTADSLTVKERGVEIEGKGNVEVRRQEMTLKADEAWVNRQTQDLEAKGNISVDHPEWKLKQGERVQFNLERETGEIEKGEIFVESGHLTMSGRRLQKFAGQTYHIDEGFFTTCLCESGPPTWKFTADEIDLKREGEGVIKRGTFYIMDVPILYIPYAVFPLRTERQTGFLFPQIGFSNRDGFLFQQPFFWAISKSADATLALDVESRARVGLLGELRTVLSRDTQGQIHLSYFNESWRQNEQDAVRDRTIADQQIPTHRWSIIASHRQTPPSGWQTYSDIGLFSDDLFTRELVRSFDLGHSEGRDFKTSRYSRSRVGFFRSWGDTSLRGEWDYYQDFIQPDKRTFQRTPQILFRGRTVLGETPLELRWRAEGVNYIRGEGADGLRLDLRPELVLPYQLGPYLRGSFNVAPRETLYHLYSTRSILGSLDRNLSRELVELGWNVGSTVGRVFDLDGSYLRKIKHTIEPEVSYLFIPGTAQRNIPIMDGTDRIQRRNLVTFALTNRLWGKYAQEPVGLPQDRDVEMVTSPTAGDVREMGRLRLALSYDIDKERRGGDSLSDLDMNLRFTPVDYLALGLDAGLDPGPWHWTQAAAVFSLVDPRPLSRRVLDPDFMQPNSLNLGYRFIRKGSNAFFSQDGNIDLNFAHDCPSHPLDPRCVGAFNKDVLSQLNANLLYHATDHVLLFLNSTYNIRDTRFSDLRASVKLLSQCECWTLAFTLKQEVNPSKTSVVFDFNLLGLGSQSKGLFR
jgi:LPS-assembly protein